MGGGVLSLFSSSFKPSWSLKAVNGSREIKAAKTIGKKGLSARGIKAAKTRFKNKYGEVIYIEDLPVLNLLSVSEKEVLFNKNKHLVLSLVDNLCRSKKLRTDFEQVAFLAALEVLAKWDKKRQLKKLIEDCVK